jgi:aspartate racemase
MKRLGVIGGMSWESTLVYYRLLNQGVAQRLGGLASAELVLHSVDFAEVAAAQAAGQWHELGDALTRAAQGLRAAGAQGLVIATNTMHKLASRVEAGSGLPLLHIADATADAARVRGLRRIALLGTRYTMEDRSILVDRWQSRHGLQALVPGDEDRIELHRIIYDELCRGVVSDASRQRIVAIIERLAAQGADAVALSCTEITLIIDDRCSPLPVLDSTALHAAAAVDWMLA